MTGSWTVWRSRQLARAAFVFVLLATSCAASDDQPSSDSGPLPSDSGPLPSDSGPLPSGETAASPETSDEPIESSGIDEALPDDCQVTDPQPRSEASVELEVISSSDDPVVRAALYPLPDHEGNPWSQWGLGTLLPDGRFVSAVGDQLGQDGNSWIYEYDPETGVLDRTVDVSSALGHEEGDWGYGKVHAPMLVTRCGEIITSTYWGTRRGLQIGGSYQGDHLIRYDPSTKTVESLGVPIPGYGLPSLALSPDGRWVFGEAVDPESEPDAGIFFVADAETGEVIQTFDDDRHIGFRSILVSPEGDAFYAIGGGDLVAVNADGTSRKVTDALNGGWLRAATSRTPDGSVFGTTRDPDALFKRSSDGTFTDLGPVEDYVASLAVAPDGGTVYYVPGAHGSGADFGTPLIAVDVDTGEHEVIVNLNDLIEPALGVTAGGTYNIVIDPAGERLFIGLNAGPPGELGETFGTVVLAVVELS